MTVESRNYILLSHAIVIFFLQKLRKALDLGFTEGKNFFLRSLESM